MNEENPVVRQVANVVTTLAFFALLGFLAWSQSLSEKPIAYILGLFVAGTSGVKATRHVVNGVTQRRMAAVRAPWRDDPPNGPPGGPRVDDVHAQVTRQVERVDERRTGPGPYERERGKGPGGIIRRAVVDWGPTVLAAALTAALLLATREPVAFASPQDPSALLP